MAFLLLLSAQPGLAQQQERFPPVLTIQRSSEHGQYLADARGRAVYLLESDSKGANACHAACAKVWPPVLAGPGSASSSAGGATSTKDRAPSQLIGTKERPDGTRQVTYNGHPLYYYVKDAGPGRATGQDVHDQWGEWYLLTPSGVKKSH